MDIYGDLKLSGDLLTHFDEVGTGGTGGSGDDLYLHHVSNHYHDELSALANLKANDGNLSVDNAYETINGDRIFISKGENYFVNPAVIKARPVGNTGVIIGGVDSLKNMEFINIRVPSDAYHFGELYYDSFDACVGSNGPRDKGILFNHNDVSRYDIFEFSIKTGVDVAFFAYVEHTSYYHNDDQPSCCSNRTLDNVVVYCTSTYFYKYTLENMEDSYPRTGSMTYHENGSCCLSNSEGDRGLCLGGTNVDTTANTGLNNIEYFTISANSDSNRGYFGSLASGYGLNHAAACSNGTLNRGIICGGQKRYWESNSWQYGTILNTIDHITISVLGNSDSFGELDTTKIEHSMVDNNMQNKAVVIGGTDTTFIMDHITISTSGIASEFGELNNPREKHCSTSNG